MNTFQYARYWAVGNHMLIGFLAGTSLVSLAAPALAQKAAPAAAVKADGQPGLDEIVVTAQRRSERLQDVPSTVVSLSSNDLAQ